MTPGLFDPPPPRPTAREDLERRLAQLVADYSAAGGERAREIDLEIRKLRRELERMPRPAAPQPTTTRRPGVARVHDGRLAATGEAKEDDEA